MKPYHRAPHIFNRYVKVVIVREFLLELFPLGTTQRYKAGAQNIINQNWSDCCSQITISARSRAEVRNSEILAERRSNLRTLGDVGAEAKFTILAGARTKTKIWAQSQS